jgi:NAD(P)-dependent dehydrogenase (short-subunit alcohol dehydrogenase family)
MAQISFDGQVAIVTGAGQGLGRSYSRELARLGAAVVVNDLQRQLADDVVAEIKADGGTAAPSYDSVATPESARAIIDLAQAQFGSVDAVINNAGSMRNGYFESLSSRDLQSMLAVHVEGSYYVTQAAWPVMREKGYGRVVMTSSAGGMFAMQGESNYAAAKGAVYGLAKALAYEGAEHGILVNTIMPMAATTIAAADPVPDYEKHYPADLAAALLPRRTTEAVMPVVVFLASRACSVTSETYSAGFGRYARVFVGETRGWVAEDFAGVSADDISEHLDEIRDREVYAVPANIYEEVEFIAATLGLAGRG